MNKKRRSRLATACRYMGKALETIEAIENEENDAYDNLPENLLNSDKAEKMEEAIDALDYVYMEIESLVGEIEEI